MTCLVHVFFFSSGYSTSRSSRAGSVFGIGGAVMAPPRKKQNRIILCWQHSFGPGMRVTPKNYMVPENIWKFGDPAPKTTVIFTGQCWFTWIESYHRIHRNVGLDVGWIALDIRETAGLSPHSSNGELPNYLQKRRIIGHAGFWPHQTNTPRCIEATSLRGFTRGRQVHGQLGKSWNGKKLMRQNQICRSQSGCRTLLNTWTGYI